MLSYANLLAQSQERGLPPGKIRGAVREYLQVLILKILSEQKQSNRLLFLGGTALRLGYGLGRFSEDLNFDAQDLSGAAWKELLERIGHALSYLGLVCEVNHAEKGNLLLGDLRFSGFLQTYRQTSNPKEKLRIKLETNRPGPLPEPLPRVVAGFGEMFPMRFAPEGWMFAEKIAALLAREMGRDIYDIFFMAEKKWRPDAKVLAGLGINSPEPGAGAGSKPAFDGSRVWEIIVKRINALGSRKLVLLAKKLEPFLFQPQQAELVARADRLLPDALGYLRD